MADLNAVAQLGSSLAASLTLHSEGSYSCRRYLPKLEALISSTASTLFKLNDLIKQNENVFTKECMKDISSITTKCKAIYIGVLILIVKRKQSLSFEEDPIDLSAEQIENMMSSLTTISIWRFRLGDWLKPRFEICEEELTQVKFELVLRYLLGSIAQHQLQTMTRTPGAWGKEASLRTMAETVSGRRATYYKRYTKKRVGWNEEDPKTPSTESSSDDVKSVHSVATSTTMTSAMPTPGAEFPGFVFNDEKLKEEPKDEPVNVTQESSSDAAKTAVEKMMPNRGFMNSTRNWFQRLFSHGNQENWDDQKIVAVAVDLSRVVDGIAQIRLDDKEVKATLSKLMSGRRWRRPPSLMEQYAALDQSVRRDVDIAIVNAKRMSSRDRTLVWMDIKRSEMQLAAARKGSGFHYTPDINVTLFFKEGDELEPIYVDHMDKKVELPYDSCQTYRMLCDVLCGVDWGFGRVPQIRNGSYDLSTDDGLPVLYLTWDSIRRPGLKLNLKFRCAVPPPPPGPYSMAPPPPHGFPVPPRPPLYNKHKEDMKQAYHEMVRLLGPANSWTPDKETAKSGLHTLLPLWTIAVDPHTEESSDDESILTYSSSSDSD